MSHFSPVPPEERTYAKNYRKGLEPYEAQLVEVSGRVKEFRDHPERKDLQSLLLVNVQVRPVGKRRLVKLSHLWVLAKHVKRVGIEPKRGRRLKFIGSVYAYFRLGGKSKQRGLHGFHDFSILPMEAVSLQTFEPGVDARYKETTDGPDTGPAPIEEGGSDQVGEDPPRRSKHRHRRRRNNRNPVKGSGNKDRQSVDDQHQGSDHSGKSGEPGTTDSTGSTKGPQN